VWDANSRRSVKLRVKVRGQGSVSTIPSEPPVLTGAGSIFPIQWDMKQVPASVPEYQLSVSVPKRFQCFSACYNSWVSLRSTVVACNWEHSFPWLYNMVWFPGLRGFVGCLFWIILSSVKNRRYRSEKFFLKGFKKFRIRAFCFSHDIHNIGGHFRYEFVIVFLWYISFIVMIQ